MLGAQGPQMSKTRFLRLNAMSCRIARQAAITIAKHLTVRLYALSGAPYKRLYIYFGVWHERRAHRSGGFAITSRVRPTVYHSL